MQCRKIFYSFDAGCEITVLWRLITHLAPVHESPIDFPLTPPLGRRRQIERVAVSLLNNTSWAHRGKSTATSVGGCLRKLKCKLGVNFTVKEHDDV